MDVVTAAGSFEENRRGIAEAGYILLKPKPSIHSCMQDSAPAKLMPHGHCISLQCHCIAAMTRSSLKAWALVYLWLRWQYSTVIHLMLISFVLCLRQPKLAWNFLCVPDLLQTQCLCLTVMFDLHDKLGRLWNHLQNKPRAWLKRGCLDKLSEVGGTILTVGGTCHD